MAIKLIIKDKYPNSKISKLHAEAFHKRRNEYGK